MSFASAGHPPAFWLSPDGECRLLGSQSAVLGCLEEAVAQEPTQEIELNSGDRLAFYTDGLTDVFDQRGEILGVEGFEEIVRTAARKPMEEMKQSILDQVEAWRDGPVTDDISLVLVELR